MKNFLVFIALFFYQSLFSQLNFDISKVKGHSKLKRDKYDIVNSDTLYGPIDLSISEHKYEIRLEVFFGPYGDFKNYILFSDGGQWTAQFWKREFYERIDDSTKLRWQSVENNNWDSVVNRLDTLDFFLLPNQSKLKKTELYIRPRAMFTVAYKIENKFREYYFYNPSDFRKHYPEVKEYAKYEQIVETFFSSFKK